MPIITTHSGDALDISINSSEPGDLFIGINTSGTNIYSDNEACTGIDVYQLRAAIDEVFPPKPATPTADDITDEMVERALNTYRDVRSQQGYVLTNNDKTLEAMSHALRVALTEPPARPEGAEELEALIDKAGEDGEGADSESLADYLAARLTDPTVKDN